MTYPGLTIPCIDGLAQIIESRIAIDPLTECHIWQGGISSSGYGRISIDGTRRYVHRVAWALANGDIPEGMVIDHLCRVPTCCNPRHLELVTQEVNIKRGMSPRAIAYRTNTCRRGHDLMRAYVNPTTGKRQCRECKGACRRAKRQKELP